MIEESGTVVIVKRMFHQMPVRFQELQRNLSKELSKLKNTLLPLFIIHSTIHFTLLNKFVFLISNLLLKQYFPSASPFNS